MGLLSGLMGNASEVDARKLQAELAKVLASSERVEKAYQLIRDMFAFTDKRLIVVNRQGLTGSKLEYQSFPYLSITRFSIETAGTIGLDRTGAVLFFQLMTRRYEHASTLLRSNNGFEEWGEIFGDDVMAAALIDRLVHH